MKSILYKLILLVTLIFCQPGLAAEEQFRLSAVDGTELTGQIDYPLSQHILGVVLLVPGTGLFDRDVEFGQTDTDKDLIFKEVSKSLTAKNFVVVRFDYRGVKCNSRNMPTCASCSNKKELFVHFTKSCFVNEIRAGVTPENIKEDIEVIYHYVASHPKLTNKKILVFGHSEGSLNISYLIASKKINPHGAVFMGGLAESPRSVIHWQMTERFSSALFEFDFNANGTIENEEIKTGHSKKLNYLHQLPLSELLSSSGHWTKTMIDEHLEKSYQDVKSEALSHSDTDPFGMNGIIQASYRWWKMFFTDEQSVIAQMRDFKGRILYLNGNLDAQTNLNRQKNEISQVITSFSRKPEMIEVTGTGHSLGADPIFGPILPSSLDLIADVCTQLINEPR